MAILRSDIERALDEIVSQEEGFRFQCLGVILAKQRWPGLIACERKNDLGLDAYLPADVAPDGVGLGVACSLTAAVGKITGDIDRARGQHADLGRVVYVTPHPVTAPKQAQWAEEVRRRHGIPLVVLSREDIVSTLLSPANAPLCASLLYLPLDVEPVVSELAERSRAAAAEVVRDWLVQRRAAPERPTIALQAARIDEDGRQAGEVLGLADMESALMEGRRIILESPGGWGKTTTLLRLAERMLANAHVAFVVNLPEFAPANSGVLDFCAGMRPFLTRGIEARGLARVVTAIGCSFLFDGWNEIPESTSGAAATVIDRVAREFPGAGIMIATRAHRRGLPLTGASRFRLLRLTVGQRMSYVQGCLGPRAPELQAVLDGLDVLERLTRIPLFLAEVTRLFGSGSAIPRSRMGILDASTQLAERSHLDGAHLEGAPLFGNARAYLTELALAAARAGGTGLAEPEALERVSGVGRRLASEGRIASAPEPHVVLASLCAHHLLQRADYPSAGYRFAHELFQDFLTALSIREGLLRLLEGHDGALRDSFLREFVNLPAFEEALLLIADEIGASTADAVRADADVVAGALLVGLALRVDPVFAGLLSRQCGEAVWTRVRGDVGSVLRAWFQEADERQRRCALAGMLATGSSDFSDILVPLLTSPDQQTRLRAYRAAAEFHPSALGSDWQSVVASWREDARADFVGEVAQDRRHVDVAVYLARIDRSPAVRAAALRALEWIGAYDTVGDLVTSYGDAEVADLLRRGGLRQLPERILPRVAAICGSLPQGPYDATTRFSVRVMLAVRGQAGAMDRLKDELGACTDAVLQHPYDPPLSVAIKLLQKHDRRWLGQWVSERLIDGRMDARYWAEAVSALPEEQRDLLLEKLVCGGHGRADSQAIAEVIAAGADAAVASRVFRELCRFRSGAGAPAAHDASTQAAIEHGLRDVLYSIPPDSSVAGMLDVLTQPVVPVEFRVVLGLIGEIGEDRLELRSRLGEALKLRLRAYLEQGVEWVMAQEDVGGQLKMNLALAISRVGSPEDFDQLRCLVVADIDRIRRVHLARLRGERTPLAMSGAISCANWHVRAVSTLDPVKAEDLLTELLTEPAYEREAVAALVRLARLEAAEAKPSLGTPDYDAIWRARTVGRGLVFDEHRRCRILEAIKARASAVRATPAAESGGLPASGSLRELARAIAMLDGRGSSALVLALITPSSPLHGWTDVEILTTLLVDGALLSADLVISILAPTIGEAGRKAVYDRNEAYLLARCLCVLPFVDVPQKGIERIRQVLTSSSPPWHVVREVVRALGYSRSDYALDLLLWLADRSGAVGWFIGECTDAIAALESPRSSSFLFGLLDPDFDRRRLRTSRRVGIPGCDTLAARLARIAAEDGSLSERLYRLCSESPDAETRSLLADVIAEMATPESLLAGLSLISDRASPRIPPGLLRALESVCLERRPHPDMAGAYVLHPRAATEVRSWLLHQYLRDDGRRQAAWELLGRVESWRVEYGRPSGEPRHPAIDAGVQWPPVAIATRAADAGAKSANGPPHC